MTRTTNTSATHATLFRAVSQNDLATVSRVLRRKGKSVLEWHQADGCTALLVACKKGNKDMVELLLNNGADLEQCDHDPKRKGKPIHYAAWGGSIELVAWLVDEKEASLGDTDVVGNTALLYAVYGGHLLLLEELLRRGRSLDEKNLKNHTVVLQAACGGHLHLVKYLLARGFDLTETDLDGNSAILFSSWGGHMELMEFLLENGSSLDEKNHNGHSLFLSAANGGRVEVVEWLLTLGFSLDETNLNGDTALLLASYGGHLPLVKRLLELGASLTDKNSCGFSSLLSAANGQQLEMARWLLANGSSLDEADGDGYTSLILASCGGSIDLVEFFLSQGASIKERNSNGDTSLLLSAYCGHRDLVAWLLRHGSTLDEKNNTGMGVLISASNGGDLSVVKLLVEELHYEDLEEQDEGGYTSFLLAAQRGHLEVCRYLAIRGANIKARTTRHDNDAIALAVDFPETQAYLRHIFDMTPLQVAIDSRDVDRVHDLLASGVDISSVSSDLATSPLALATRYDPTRPGSLPVNDELVKLLRAATQPWSPFTHQVFGPGVRQTCVSVMILRSRLLYQDELPLLPIELWYTICSFISPSWYASDEQTVARSNTTAVGRASRQKWRRRRLLKITDMSVDDSSESELSSDYDDDDEEEGDEEMSIEDVNVRQHHAAACAEVPDFDNHDDAHHAREIFEASAAATAAAAAAAAAASLSMVASGGNSSRSASPYDPQLFGMAVSSFSSPMDIDSISDRSSDADSSSDASSETAAIVVFAGEHYGHMHSTKAASAAATLAAAAAAAAAAAHAFRVTWV